MGDAESRATGADAVEDEKPLAPSEPRASGSEAIRDATALAPADPRVAGTAAAGDQRALVRSIIGTGIGVATLVLMLAGLQLQQNVSVNLRIDDLNATLNARIDDVNARIDDVNARIDDLQEDIRELRALIIDALHRADPAD